MRTSLIITTYNRPDALLLVLKSALHQSKMPDEIVIADDGSGESTRNVIDGFKADCPVPVIHAWQEDIGFRAAAARNKGAIESHGDYLVFLDGDMIMHPDFLRSHVESARPGYFLHGKRAMLSSRRTNQIIGRQQIRISPWSLGITLRKHAFHIPILSRRMSYDSTDWHATQSANLSVWRKDLIAVNGFNEDFEGWGLEDSELALRLMRYGLKKKELRFCAVTFHLSHGKDSKMKYQEEARRNNQLLEQIQKSNLVRCTHGIDAHLPEG